MTEKNILIRVSETERDLWEAREKLDRGEDIEISPLMKNFEELLKTIGEHPLLKDISSGDGIKVSCRIREDINYLGRLVNRYIVLKRRYL